ncbi:MAG TPA: ArsA-related P-loop ATPase [Baekduia sp.]|nr:ArsA-related P-loop ATPase [Baekduia sp.]
MMTAIDDDKRLVVVTGKGGTGRTTVAAALALGAARSGRRTIVAEVGGQARVPALLGVGAGGEAPVARDLWATTIDTPAALEEWLGRQLPRRLAGILARSGAFAGFVGAAPGARELVTVTKAWELGQARRWRRGAAGYDTVVLDAPASGHGLGLLRTPRTFADIARVGPIASQARAVAEALADPARSTLIAVALPGELAVAETLELEARVATTLGRPLDAIVVNGVWPRRIAAREAAAIATRDGDVGARTRRAVAAAAGRVRAQQTQLARLRRDAAAAVHTLPFVFAERIGSEHLYAFSDRLDAAGLGQTSVRAGTALQVTPPPPTIGETTGEYDPRTGRPWA